MDITIEEMDLTVRTYNVLKRAGINDATRLASFSEEELNQNTRNLGRKSKEEIKTKLAELGLSLKEE